MRTLSVYTGPKNPHLLRALIALPAMLLSGPLAMAQSAQPAVAPPETAQWVGWFQRTFMGVSMGQYAGVLGLIFAALLIRRVVSLVVSSQVRRAAGLVSARLEQSVGRSALPVSGLSMALVFWIGFPLLGFPAQAEEIIAIAVRVLAVASSVLLFYRQVDVVSDIFEEKAAATETKLDDQLVPLVRRTVKAFVFVVGSIFILQNLNVNVASLVAGLGLGGLAFALAAKDTVANAFGSLVIFIDRPFQIGDWVIIDGIEGVVEDVRFRTTRIRTFYDSLVTVPNAKLTATAIDNLGMRQYRRLKTTLGLTYSTTPQQMQAFVEGLRAIVAAHPETRKDKYEIHFNNYGAYSLDVLFYVYFKVPAWSDELRARHEVLLSALKLADDLGVEFAFPTSTLHVDSFYGKKPREVGRRLKDDQLRSAVTGVGPGGASANPDFRLTQGYFAGQVHTATYAGNEEDG